MELRFCDERRTVFIYATKEDLLPYLDELRKKIETASTLEELSEFMSAGGPAWLECARSVDRFLERAACKEIEGRNWETGIFYKPLWTPFGGRPSRESPAPSVFAMWKRGQDKFRRLWSLAYGKNEDEQKGKGIC